MKNGTAHMLSRKKKVVGCDSHNFSQNKRNRPWSFLITQIHHIELLMKSQLHLCTVDKCVYEEESFLNMKRGEIVPFQEPCSLR